MVVQKKIDKQNVQDIISLTPLQEGMLFHYIADSNQYYFEQLTLKLTGQLDVELFKRAWNTVVDHNEMLRTIFRWEKLPKPIQIILKESPAPIRVHDLMAFTNQEKERLVAKITQEDQQEQIDLRTEPFRITLILLSEQESIMIISNHHILYDGWSNGIILKEFFQAYDHLATGQMPIASEKNTFKEFIKWQQRQDQHAQDQFWADYLAGFDTKTLLPNSIESQNLGSGQAHYTFTLETELTEKLHELAQKNRITPASLFYCGWGLLLQHYNNNDDVLFGTTVSGRNVDIKNIENMVGLFINTIPLRVKGQSTQTILTVAKDIDQGLKERSTYEHVPLVEIKSVSEIDGQGELFDSIVVIENYPLDQQLNHQNQLQVDSYAITESTNFALTLAIEMADPIKVQIHYDRSRLDPLLITQIVKHYSELLYLCITNPEEQLAEISLVTPEEKVQIIQQFNDTQTDYPREKTIMQLFEEQVVERPDQVALVFAERQLSYYELNERANALANLLRDQGVGEEMLVGIMAERSIEMVVGVLAILKAGGAYLPIDPEYPADRIAWMLQDCSVETLLVQGSKQNLCTYDCKIIDLIDEKSYLNRKCQVKNLTNPQSLAYVIYTSGSTGRPKGVMVEQRNVVRLVKNTNYINFTPGEKIFQTGTLAFDASTFEIWGALLNGLELHLGTKDIILQREEMEGYIRRHKINTMWLTAPLFHILADERPEMFKSLDHLLVGGDVLSPKHINKVRQTNPELKVINGYGPTENTTFSTCFQIDQDYAQNIPIGRPISNSTALIVDRHNHLTPIGIYGELCVGGDGLARGYLNNPELTAERFVENPFIQGEKMYRTGDLARWLPDGKIEFMGRIDHQVKIRGFRIELGEVEAALLQHPELTEAIVLDRKDQQGNKYLVAYFVAHREFAMGELRGELAQHLPDYMIPSYFVQLAQMPLNQNGKIDRQALPEPERAIVTQDYVAPETPIQQQLAEIWHEVLGVKAGIYDNFFDLGGHSLKATILVSRIHKELDVAVPLNEIFQRPTIKELADYLQSAEEQVYSSIPVLEEREYYLASSAQKRMYLLQQYDLESTTYNIPAVFKLHGKLDLERLNQVFQLLIERHEILRTSFTVVDGQVMQQVHQDVPFAVDYLEEIATMTQTIDELVQDFVRSFDLSQVPLFRVRVIPLAEEQYLMISDLHHIIADGTSTGILINEIAQLYQGGQLTELRIQYKDFAAWQQQMLESAPMQRQKEYWLQEFAGEIPVLNLPTDYPRPLVQSLAGDQLSFTLDRELAQKLNELARQTGSTLYMLLLAGVNILFAKYSGQEDIVIGSPIADRPHADLEPLIGMFVNTLALRNQPGGEKTYLEFLQEVKTKAVQAYDHQDYQFEELIDQLHLQRDLSRNPLFDVMFGMQNMSGGDLQMGDLQVTPYNYATGNSKFDLLLLAQEVDGQILFNLDYSSALFKRETVERMMGHLTNIMQTVATEPERQIAQIELISDQEKEMLLTQFNQTSADYPRDRTLQSLFEEAAEEVPDEVALLDQGQKLTYRELNELANGLARTLRAKGVGPDQIVGILADRSFEMVIGIMAILKAGGAYLPITPEYPVERIRYLLTDSQAQVLLVQTEHLTKVDFTGETLNLNSPDSFASDRSNLDQACTSKNLAYVIYTSGSTGEPKGVLVEHQSVVNILTNLQADYPLLAEGTYLLKTTFTFDVSVSELFGWFMGHGRLAILPPEGEKNLQTIVEAIDSYRVTHLNFVPSMLSVFLDGLSPADVERLQSLQYVFVAGEAFPRELVKGCQMRLPGVRIENIYGPTEATIYVTRYSTRDLHNQMTVPIGKPLNNVRAYVLDQDHHLVPLGVPGELCIAGESLARGYFNRPELSREKFVADPFVSGEKMYKTGDLVRWLADGNLEFLGRIDHQVKIRGFRIELGEIESRLLEHPRIKETVVVDREDQQGSKYLVAYLVAEGEISVSEVREFLLNYLPEYMVPSHFIPLAKMPLNTSGKIDRKALPVPEMADGLALGTAYVAPRNQLEAGLAQVWAENLGVEQVGINDNYFELGGHSLKATLLISKMHQALGVEIPLSVLFKSPTIKGISEYIQETSPVYQYQSIPRVEAGEYYQTSSAQKRMYLLQQYDLESLAYNMPGLLQVTGELNLTQVERTCSELVRRHETLRTSFERRDEEIVQIVNEGVEFTVEHFDLRAKLAAHPEQEHRLVEEQIEAFVRPFDLGAGYLFRLGLIQLTDSVSLLIYDLHHIIADGISMGVLISDFVQLYEGNDLPELTIQYKDFATWQNQQVTSPKMRAQAEYWQAQFSDDELPVLNLPTDFTRPALQSYEGATYSYTLGQDLTSELKRLAQETGSTLYMVLLSGIQILLSRYTGQEDLIIGTPIAGRSHADLEQIIGMFINTLAMRNQPVGTKGYLEFLAEVRETALAAYENQDYQFEELVETLQIQRDLSRNPLFDVLFSMQNMQLEELKLANITFEPYEYANQIAKFDLAFVANEVDGAIRLDVDYSSKLFKGDTIEKMVRHLIEILKHVTDDREVALKDIQMLTAAEVDLLLHQYNDTAAEYPKEKLIHQLFEEQAASAPNQVAVVYEGQSLTYGELNERANRLARTLRAQGVTAESSVGLMVHRSLDLAVGIMAILKAGGVYLPINPDYPEERVRYMLEDSGAQILLTHADLESRVPFAGHILSIEDESNYAPEGSNLEHVQNSNQLAYIIYTSGSTGQPKGVMIRHHSLVNYLYSIYDHYQREVGRADRCLSLANISFDASISEIFIPLSFGATLVLYKNELIPEINHLVRTLVDEQVTLAYIPPTILQEVYEGLRSQPVYLNKLFVGVEPIKDHVLAKYLSLHEQMQILNAYGPTEGTIVATCYKVGQTPPSGKNVPIGKPLANTKIYLLDQYQNLVLPGVAGELCISGDGLANGYLNKEDLTREKFVSHPFSPGERMYKTGDLARWLPDGNVEFLGRQDHQVKIRGYRIEPGEIQSQLLNHPDLTEVTVIDRVAKDGGKYLAAYLVAKREVTAGELREFLLRTLPDYMIPSYFVQLPKLPLTPNGKVDRKALPEPAGNLTLGTEYVAPQNQTQAKLAEIWQEVLGVSQVGIRDNYFELGGHSLKATVLVSKIHKELNVEVPLSLIFKQPTIEGISQFIQQGKTTQYEAITPVAEQEYYEASSAQKRMYLIQQFDLDSTGYNMPVVLEMAGALDLEKVKGAFTELVRRHETLRTTFVRIGEQIVQQVHEPFQVQIEEHNLEARISQVSPEVEPELIAEQVAALIRPFDLEQGPLFRIGLIQLSECRSLLIYDMHHIISDGTSVSILINEFVQLYEGRELPELRIQYKDYAAWQNQYLTSDKMTEQGDYWLQRFSDELPTLELPTDFPRPVQQSLEGDYLSIDLEPELTQAIQRVAKETGATVYMVMLSAIQILLSKYSGQEDLIIGTPIAGRPHADLEKMIGMFINTLPMRNQPVGDKSYLDYLAEVKMTALEAYENQEYQFEELIEELNLQRDLSRNPLFDVIFNLQNMQQERLELSDVTIQPYPLANQTSKFDLSFTAQETDQRMSLGVEYSTKLFKRSSIRRMTSHLVEILQVITADPQVALQDIQMLTAKERELVLYGFNATQAEYPKGQQIHQLFEEQVRAIPEAVAVLFDDDKLTYRELNAKANGLARTLREKGVGPDQIVGILADRSFEMVVGIMAILKAGGAYLPITPEYPAERISYLLTDSQAQILLVQQAELVPVDFAGETLLLDDPAVYSADRSNLAQLGTAQNLAYVIYTSGSTGEPKGVLVEHQSVVNILTNLQQDYPITSEGTYLLKTTFTFDVSVTELFGWFMGQGRLAILPPEGEKQIQTIVDSVARYDVTHINFVPSMLNVFLDGLGEAEVEHLQSLQYVLVAGEAFPRELVRRCQAKLPEATIENIYGPTETTIYVTRYSTSDLQDEITVPIGKPLNNLQAYVLNTAQQLVPIGVPGELCIAGDCLARGYFNRPELMAEKFVENPFSKGKKMYRTGDLVRWLPNGNIEFLGRIDHQVKIRGFRIELGEIESRLLEHPVVKETVVMDRTDQAGSKYLAAYLVAEEEIQVGEIREFLLESLPEYMVPSYFVQLAEMPLNTSGKVNRQALPEPQENLLLSTEYQAPRNAIEARLVKIWQETLGVEQVGINDNYFELGGHSLKATVLASRIHKELNVEVPLSQIFKEPTVQQQAQYIQQSKTSGYQAIQLVEEREEYLTSSAQKRMYMLQQFDLTSTVYNMPGIFQVEGRLDVERVAEAFQKLIQRHETLRTTFARMEDHIVQKVHPVGEFHLEILEQSDLVVADSRAEVGKIINEFVRPFDLNRGPLFRVGLLPLSPEKYLLLYDIHHIISDGISMGILIRDFVQLYQGYELPELRIQYKDYAQWQRDQLATSEMQQQRQYWLERFSDELPVLELPTDAPRPLEKTLEGATLEVMLDAEVTRGLGELARATGSTLYMVLLSGINILLSRYSGQEDIIIGSPIAGRPHGDLEELIGIFINTLAMRNYPQGTLSYKQFLEEVKANALMAYENQEYQFEDLVEELEIRRDLSRNPLFDVMFAMQNMEQRELQLPEVTLLPYQYDNPTAKLDLSIFAWEKDGSLVLNFEYSSRLFKPKTIQQMSHHLQKIFTAIVADPTIQLQEIDLLTEAEKRQLLDEFNQTEAEYPKDQTLHGYLEAQVELIPDQVALISQTQTWTYREVNEQANRLARTLRAKGVQTNQIVGVICERSCEMMVGILAILKAGGAYLPINPKDPVERIQYLLEDSQTTLVLAQPEHQEKAQFAGEVINLADDQLYQLSGENLARVNTATDLAYVIYTSGSTGQPKGVLVEHQSVLNTLSYMEKEYPLGADGVYLLKTAYTFDVSVTELFGWLMGQGKLAILPPEGEKDVLTIAQAIADFGVTHLNFVPSMLNVFLNGLGEVELEKLDSLRYLFVAGEAFSGELVRLCRQKLPQVQVENIYGPTETTIYVTRFSTSQLTTPTMVPIGEPLDNVQAYVVNQGNQLMPLGVAGELCISGDCVTRGYLNRPALTAEKFVANPFRPGHKMYRTGDLVRWLPDGKLEFLGRIDHQVKIRGYRIELGELENQLLRYEPIQEVVVIDRADADGVKYLVAYLVATEEVTVSELRGFLLQTLPEYMIPAYFVQLDQMPLNASGKLNRKALPSPEGNMALGTEYVAPTNELEEQVVSIWEELLGVEQIGMNDNYFELGGHSLKATVLISEIHKKFNVEIPLSELFKRPTAREMAQYIACSEENQFLAIRPIPEQEYYLASSAQQRIYLQNQFEGSDVSYNMPGAVTIAGPLDQERFCSVFKQLIARHETLRTSFAMRDGEVVQQVHSEVDFAVEYFEAPGDEGVPQILSQFVRPFDLGQAPLLRVGLITVAEEQQVLIFDLHHIISDGVSMDILINEFSSLYQGVDLKELAIQYRDFSAWQNELLQSEYILAQEEYWLETFAGEIPVLNLPTDYPRPSMQSFKGDRMQIEAGSELSTALKELAARTGTTPYMLLLAAYNVLLYRYTGQKEIVVGSPIAGRRHADLQKMIGMFVNMLALKNTPTGKVSFLEFLGQVKENTLQAFDHQDYQYEDLVEKLNLQRNLSRNPLFDVSFSLHASKGELIRTEELTFVPYDFESNVSKFDLTLDVVDQPDQLVFSFEYCTDLFTQDRIQRLAGHYLNLLHQIAVQPQATLAELEMLSPEERAVILTDFNATQVEYERELPIHKLIEAYADQAPDDLAIVFDAEQMTFGELNRQTNQLARYLRTTGVQPDQIIGIMAERSIEMIIGIVGVLKAGGAYMPIDPDYPEERIRYMLEDSQAQIMLTDQSSADQEALAEIVLHLKDEKLYQTETGNLSNVNTADDLAYIMYTSGSTGKPKGVMLGHRGVVNIAKYYHDMFCLEKGRNFIHMGNVSFDASIVEIFPALIYGATIHIIRKEDALDQRKFARFIQEHQIHIAQFVPMTLKELLAPQEKLTSLDTVLVAGDKLEDTLKNRILSLGYRLTNHYGPTEGTVDSVVARCQENHTTIGKPIYNTRIYILDQDNNPTPIGVPGELCVAGDGLARGYLNKPDLTAEKFVEHPFISGERIYRTGDLVSWQADGNISFLGRIDNQVKIRGYRIEMGEIELQLLQHQEVRDAVVIDRVDSNGGKYLCAYIVGARELTATELRKYLAAELPDYMIPARFVQMDRIPLTHNDKVDRKALPEPEGGMESGIEYVAPTNRIEEKLIAIWQEILDLDGIGIAHNFFELGGHSLKATVLVARIHKELEVEVPFSQVFKTPTIKELAEYILSAEQSGYQAIQPVEEMNYYPVSSSQKRIHIVWQLNEQSISYNMPSAVILEGELDRHKVELAIQGLCQRHEALRTSFVLIDGEPKQQIADQVQIPIHYLTAKEAELDDLVREFIQPFDLRQAPLFRVALIELAEAKHMLLFDLHHIISDGVSAAILTKDFASLYEGQELPELRVQYKDYASWHNSLMESEAMQQMGEYWLDKLAHFTYTELPQKSYASMEEAGGVIRRLELDQELTAKINDFCVEHQTTKFAFMLSVFKLILMKTINQEDLTIGIPVAGRRHEELEKMIGVFLNVLTIRSQLFAESTYTEYLTQLSENLMEAQEKQDYPYEYLYAQAKERYNFQHKSLFSILFNFMPYQEDEELRLDGIVVKPYELGELEAKYSLTIYVTEGPDQLYVNAVFQNNIEEYVIENMLASFETVISTVLDQEEICLHQVSLAGTTNLQDFSQEFEMEFDNDDFF